MRSDSFVLCPGVGRCAELGCLTPSPSLSAVQHKLEGALLALGQFQHALSELQAWLSHTHATLDTQRPVGSDPKAIEIELAKHHVSSFLSHTHALSVCRSVCVCLILCCSLSVSSDWRLSLPS